MTQDEIIRMANDLGRTHWRGTYPDGTNVFLGADFDAGSLFRLVELVEEATKEKAAKDAERYQWLKNKLHAAVGGGITINDEALIYEEPNEEGIVRLYWYPNTPVGFTEVTGNTLDEVVDEAMTSEPQP